MAVAFKCDKCGKFFDYGFQGSWQKDLMQGKRVFAVAVKVEKNPHLCKACWPKFCKLLYDEMRGSYALDKKLENRVSQTKG